MKRRAGFNFAEVARRLGRHDLIQPHTGEQLRLFETALPEVGRELSKSTAAEPRPSARQEAEHA